LGYSRAGSPGTATRRTVTELVIESTSAEDPPAFEGASDELVHFLSFAVAERYGATHDLSGIARILRTQAGRDVLRPLLTFAEDNPADADDRRDMDQIWQEAQPVAESAAWAATQLRASRVLQGLATGFPALAEQLDELARVARWSAERRARIRLLFRL
jgi:hypothetical protein